MLAATPQVAQDVRLIAAGVFEGVGQDGEAVERAVNVDGLGKTGDGGGEAGGERSSVRRVFKNQTLRDTAESRAAV
jgi:hypothetical protein